MLIKSFTLGKVTVAVGLASCLFSMGIAHADTVQVKETGLGLGLASGGLVLPVQASSANYWAGFQTIKINDTTSFQALCVDPYQWSTSINTSYNRSYVVADFNTYFGSRAADVVALYNQSFASATTNANAAAMQLALWEVGNDDKSLSTGIVHTVSGTNGGLITNTQSLLTNLNTYSYTGPSQYTFTLYTSSTNQDYLVATPVPEPETYAMFLAGLGLMGLIARRRKLKESA